MSNDPNPLPVGRSIALLAGLIGVCFAVAALGGLTTAEGVREWYPTLDKPPWTPPNWAFGPVWTFLYTAMAVAIWDVVRRDPSAARTASAWFAAQLLLNALWSPLFFGLQLSLAALAVISGMWVCIAACIAAYWPHSKLGSALMVPYLAWVSIAWTLNAWIWWFN